MLCVRFDTSNSPSTLETFPRRTGKFVEDSIFPEGLGKLKIDFSHQDWEISTNKFANRTRKT